MMDVPSSPREEKFAHICSNPYCVAHCGTGITGSESAMTKDDSFPRNAEYWAELQNFPVSAEFLRFRRIFAEFGTGRW